ncbi:MAG: carboxypeptidase-like regulatory domain-containing protein [Pirellulales bacterium]|nr:carboxypeptidase-like regulatory domain-containing protein [Pirellulales bacterium]
MTWLAAAAVVAQPQLLFANEIASLPSPQPTMQMPHDVVLAKGGLLVGQLVNEQGAPMPMTPVSLWTVGKEVARLTTDKAGKFQAENLRGGVYQVVAVGHQGVYRLWAPQTAPPAAQQQLTVISRNEIVRGQFTAPPGNPFSSIGQFVAEHPILTASAVAAAIAIPIAVDDDPSTP